jgi:iron(III) transport system substrate-binding protein
MKMVLRVFGALVALAGSCGALGGDAPRSLNLLCSVPLPWCEALATTFENKNGMKVAVTQKAAAEVPALLAAQRAAPRFDVWYGGAGDLHLQAAEGDTTDEYRSPHLPELRDWSVQHARQSRYRSGALYLRAIGIAVNTQRLAAKQLPEPKCWSDLARPEYDDQLQMGQPGQSSAARATLVTLVQLFGEEKAFDLIKRIHGNVGSYTRRATNAARAVARGDATLAVIFLYEGATEIAAGFPVKLITPCEGLGYDVVGMSLVKQARNREGARLFYDWALTPEALELEYSFSFWQMPAHRAASLAPQVPRTDGAKLVAYDSGRFGVAERKRLSERWEREVSVLPR